MRVDLSAVGLWAASEKVETGVQRYAGRAFCSPGPQMRNAKCELHCRASCGDLCKWPIDQCRFGGGILAAECGGSSAWTIARVASETRLWRVSCPDAAVCVAVGTHDRVLTLTEPTGGPGAWAIHQLVTGQCLT
jgi:hypothetical protein